MQGGNFGDVSLTGAEVFLLVFVASAVLGPLVGAISWLAKRMIDDKDRQIRELQALLQMNMKTTEKSVNMADKTVSFTEEQLAQFARVITAEKRDQGA